MLALSIRQPWAWHILNSGKDIENRDWYTRVRGRILIHASKGMTRDEYEAGQDPLWAVGGPTNSTGVKGVVRRGEKFRALIRVDGVLLHLGTFHSVAQAAQARLEAEKRFHE